MSYNGRLLNAQLLTTKVPEFLNYPLSITGFFGYRQIMSGDGEVILLVVIEVVPTPTQQLEIFEWLRARYSLTAETYLFINRGNPAVGLIEPSEYIY